MTFFNHWLLTILLLVPAVGGVVVLLVRSPRAVRGAAIGIALGVLSISLLVLILFQRQPGSYDYAPAGVVQMSCSAEILPAIHWSYRVAVDGMSLPFLVVASLIGVLACAATPSGRQQARWFFAMLLWLEAAALGVFVSFDLLLLWIFLAVALVPCCALIGIDGRELRGRAILIFLIPMLIALACLFVGTLGERLMSTHCLIGGTLDLVRLAAIRCAEPSLFLLLLIGFVIMLPVFPLHSWVAAVAKSSSFAATAMILGLIPLMGSYGLLRVVVPLFPSLMASMGWLPAGAGLLMVVYCALCAIGANDTRSATAHIALSIGGFALIGVATLTLVGLNAALIIFLSQSLLAPYMIALTASVTPGTERASPYPLPIACLVLGWLAELVFPGLLGQMMVLLGTFQERSTGSTWSAYPWAYAIAGMTCIGMLLVGIGGARILRRIVQPNEPRTSQSDMSQSLHIAVAAFLLAMGIVPLCIFYARGGLAAMMISPR